MRNSAKWFLLLHLDFGGVCQQQRVQQSGGAAAVLSVGFILQLYGGMLAALVVYAFGWQQVIKHLPLTTAYANKAITVVWGILLGFLLFGGEHHPAPVYRCSGYYCGHRAVCAGATKERTANEPGNSCPTWHFICSAPFGVGVSGAAEKAALREHKSLLAEYTDWRVVLGYGLFVGCSLLTMLAYKGVPLNVGPVLESTGYIYVTFFGVVIFHEKMNP